MLKFSNFLLNFLLFLFSYVIPKDKDLILFGCGGAKQFKGNSKYLYLYLHENSNKKEFENLNYFWVTENNKVLERLNEKGCPVLYKYSLKSFFAVLRANLIIIDQSAKDFSYFGSISGRYNIVQTWHGTPLKKIGIGVSKGKNGSLMSKLFDIKWRNESQNYKLILSPSKEVSHILKDVFRNNSIRVTGYPRNDILLNSDLFLRKNWNLKKYSKIISYIPTFRDTETKRKPFQNLKLKKFNEYLKKNNILFVLKKHPFDKNFPDFKEYSNIKDYSGEIEDVQELLVHTDILITDYSSVFFDFVLTNKPIIYYPYDYEEYLKTCRGMYYDYYSELPGPFAKTEKELYDLIKSVDSWFGKKEYQEKQMRFKKKFNKYQDGNSCERVLKILEEKI